MAITSLEDKKSIIEIILADDYVQSLGFTRDDIFVYSGNKKEEVTSLTKKITITNKEPSTSGNMYAHIKYGIEVMIVQGQSGTALSLLDHLIKVFRKCDIGNNHIAEIEQATTEYTADDGFTRHGITIGFSTPI